MIATANLLNRMMWFFFILAMKAKITAGTTYCATSKIHRRQLYVLERFDRKTEIQISVLPPIHHPTNKFYVP